MVKRFLSIFFIVTLTLTFTMSGATAVNQGDKCAMLNQTKVVNGVTWQCISKNGTLVWDEKLFWDKVSMYPGQTIEGYHDISTSLTTLVPQVLMARLGRVGTEYIWSIPIANLPKGFSRSFLSRYGVVSGVGEISAGEYWILFKVRDSALKPFSWSSKYVKLKISECSSGVSIEQGAINNLCPKIVLNFPNVSNYLIAGKKGQPYAISLSVQGGNPPFKWTLIGVKPLGMWFNTRSGVFYGKPTQARTNIFQIRVTDSSGEYREQTIKWLVKP